MTLNLDARQRAMLAEMGVRFWWPQDAAPPAHALNRPDAAQAPGAAGFTLGPVGRQAQSGSNPGLRPSGATAAGRAGDESLPATVGPPAPAAAGAARGQAKLPPGSAPPDADRRPDADAQGAGPQWALLRREVAACQACRMGAGRRAAVLTRASAASLRADWLVLGEPPDEAQERLGEPFVEQAGQLLDNMLRAVGVMRRAAGADLVDRAGGTSWAERAVLAQPDAVAADPAHLAHLSLALKCRPALPCAPDAQVLQQCSGFLRREIALVQPRVLLAMGRVAMQVLLSEAQPQASGLPLGKLRARVWRFQGLPVVVTYPPAYLLRHPQDKARAWADLCLAADVAQGLRTD